MTTASVSPPPETRVGHVLYLLYLAGLVSGFVTLLIALVVAYVYRTDAAPWLRAHYQFLISTFWIGLLYMVAAVVLSVLVIGLGAAPAAGQRLVRDPLHRRLACPASAPATAQAIQLAMVGAARLFPKHATSLPGLPVARSWPPERYRSVTCPPQLRR